MSRSGRVIRKSVSWAIGLLYHSVEVRQPPGLTSSGPQLANASHFGGFSDPLLLIYAMDRVPRFIARDVIWKFPVIRNLLNWVGAIPVHKSDDGGSTSNDEMFRSTYDALGDEDIVTIFPEGITVDDPRIANIKTGSARIALGARASGVTGITLLSAGIHYENKAVLRSNVFVDIGYPLDLDTWVEDNIAPGEPQDASNRDAVKALTAEMEKRLRWAAPDFDDWTSARLLSSAAGIALRGVEGAEAEPGHADRERLARLVEVSSEPLKQNVVDAMDVYESDLNAFGYNDQSFLSEIQSKRKFLADAAKQLVVGLILLPTAAVGLLVNAIPMSIVWLIGRLKVADAVMATLKPIGAILAFLVTWGVWMWIVIRSNTTPSIGPLATIAVMSVLMPIYLFALIALFERTTLLAQALKSFARSRSIGDVHDALHEHRSAVVEAVAQAV